VGKTESGFVARFAHLVGLHAVPQPRRLELLPYTLAAGTYDDPVVPGNPFDPGSRYFGGAGLDVKYGVTSNLTIDAAFNPDFGQVEIDPAFVNLTAFEQFLPEHRPFFIEGADIFGFGGNGGGFSSFGGTPQFFYSRRIGRPPHGDATSPGPGRRSTATSARRRSTSCGARPTRAVWMCSIGGPRARTPSRRTSAFLISAATRSRSSRRSRHPTATSSDRMPSTSTTTRPGPRCSGSPARSTSTRSPATGCGVSPVAPRRRGPK